MKIMMVFFGFAVAMAATPALAGGDYENPWVAPSPTSIQRTNETIYMLSSRRVTGEEVDHRKAPIYFYAPRD
jgi:hypothetical protein